MTLQRRKLIRAMGRVFLKSRNGLTVYCDDLYISCEYKMNDELLLTGDIGYYLVGVLRKDKSDASSVCPPYKFKNLLKAIIKVVQLVEQLGTAEDYRRQCVRFFIDRVNV